jgi:D-tyrosyl-tRNA(Tyr) deacylase
MGVKKAQSSIPGVPVVYLQHPNRARLQRSNQMRVVIQRVSRARVIVNEEIAGAIGRGLLVLLGVGREDSEADAVYLVEKISGLRIFEDEGGKMNRSVRDVGGSVLAVSQFTLYGDVRRGKRPSFDAAAPPEKAREIYEFFVEQLRAAGLRCETGRFQEIMQVEMVNEGPVTILLDSAKEF